MTTTNADIRDLLSEYRKLYGTGLHLPRRALTLARIAYEVANRLGHIALRQGESVECPRCGASGSVREVLSGAVHTQVCASAPAKVSRCSGCGEPAHASETDDLDRCTTCQIEARNEERATKREEAVSDLVTDLLRRRS